MYRPGRLHLARDEQLPMQSGSSYPIRLRMIIIGVLMATAAVFYGFPRFDQSRSRLGTGPYEEVVEQINIPETRQFEISPPPPRPSILVESTDEDIAEDITIAETDLKSFAWEAPPPMAQEPGIRFIPYDVPPEPIGGLAAIQKKIVYPELARKAGIEGTVTLQVFVNERGLVEDVVVLKGIPPQV